jgi:hypothetical protein
MDKNTLSLILDDLVKAVGPYNKIIVIGGGYAPLVYRHFLSNEKQLPEPAATLDIDLLIPRKVKVLNDTNSNLGVRLQKSGFKIQRRTLGTPPVESYFKTIVNLEIEVEFLTDRKSRDQEKVFEIEGVAAQTLSFLEMSLNEAVEFETSSGAPLQVVTPGAWIFHKILTFDRRQNPVKSFKDLYGIWYVGNSLKDISTQSLLDLSRLARHHKARAKVARKSFSAFTVTSTPEKWLILEKQDPEGRLTKTRFLDFSERVLNIL